MFYAFIYTDPGSVHQNLARNHWPGGAWIFLVSVKCVKYILAYANAHTHTHVNSRRYSPAWMQSKHAHACLPLRRSCSCVTHVKFHVQELVLGKPRDFSLVSRVKLNPDKSYDVVCKTVCLPCNRPPHRRVILDSLLRLPSPCRTRACLR
jgi:hypothetical protein